MGKIVGNAIKLLFSLKDGGNKAKMDKALKKPFETSCHTLRDILTYNRETAFAKEHDFDYILAAGSDEELIARYREKISPKEYEDFRPYADRQLA